MFNLPQIQEPSPREQDIEGSSVAYDSFVRIEQGISPPAALETAEHAEKDYLDLFFSALSASLASKASGR